ncbi:MAG: hypothetical protein F4087_05745 [Gemmatimonadetes bacterium]|nr:hypothetical protein [Gemmatimonadota bacterium]MXX35336.1 hypothetical protein [Gemmatimonadota bacterium]MYA10358.1 hypothetical protein [Gemmatimonadota bacterium]MYD15242.1 hypothetical protein [Gemmatimonadota bacterium]MYE68707.1 hypothetical protein [Gemmatimonadota bacterium]
MTTYSPPKIRMGLTGFAAAVMVIANNACATTPEGALEAGQEPITVRVENLTSRVITVDRIVAVSGSYKGGSFQTLTSRGERPVTRRVGLVNGKSSRTLTVPWISSRLAHQMLWLEGAERIATGTETLSPGQNHLSYHVEECRGEGLRACVATSALHLPPGAEVTLVVDRRHVATLYYDVPAEDVGRNKDGIPLR